MKLNQFTNYTFKKSKGKFTREQEQYIKLLLLDDGESYFNWLDTKFLPVQFDNKKLWRKKVFILSLAFGTKTKSGYGSFFQSNYIVWKKGKTFQSENINANDKIKVLDLDWDGIPEIYSTYESRGEASTCELFGYKDNSYRKIIFPTGDHYCHDMKIKPDGKIEIKEDKKTTKYRYEKGILKEVLRK
ncbi:MAG: hypothetical protein KBA66_03210 [Leptospiraceae bacterium]|nr:hypothetical protein [Leptospiraceae bacterium]